jgi:hypothetical protein
MTLRSPPNLTFKDVLVQSEGLSILRELSANLIEGGSSRKVATIDYSSRSDEPNKVTIYDWSVNWADSGPLERTVSYLKSCLYRSSRNYTILVEGDNLDWWLTQGFSYSPGVGMVSVGGNGSKSGATTYCPTPSSGGDTGQTNEIDGGFF